MKSSIQNSANRGDTDQTSPSVASDLGLHALYLSRKRVNYVFYKAKLVWLNITG